MVGVVNQPTLFVVYNLEKLQFETIKPRENVQSTILNNKDSKLKVTLITYAWV